MQQEELKSFLEQSIEQREKEVTYFNIDIKNFQFSIEEIEKNYSGVEQMELFKQELQKNIEISEIQKLKSTFIRDSLKKQLEDLTSQSNT
jgi:hypothetical protein